MTQHHRRVLSLAAVVGGIALAVAACFLSTPAAATKSPPKRTPIYGKDECWSHYEGCKAAIPGWEYETGTGGIAEDRCWRNYEKCEQGRKSKPYANPKVAPHLGTTRECDGTRQTACPKNKFCCEIPNSAASHEYFTTICTTATGCLATNGHNINKYKDPSFVDKMKNLFKLH
ncbi:hypothetical protein HK405_004799 [Cladochytrium tenue]|nr:hypothetical protein HK405_004799 [Cladochytrium tenue]